LTSLVFRTALTHTGGRVNGMHAHTSACDPT